MKRHFSADLLSTGISLGTPVFLLWNGAVLWALYGESGSRLFSERYRSWVDKSSDLKVWLYTSPFSYLPALLLVGMLVIAFSR